MKEEEFMAQIFLPGSPQQGDDAQKGTQQQQGGSDDPNPPDPKQPTSTEALIFTDWAAI